MAGQIGPGYGDALQASAAPIDGVSAAEEPGSQDGMGSMNAMGEGPRAVYKRLPSLQGLSVDVGHVPGGGTAAGLPQGSGNAPEVTILRRFSRQESTAAAGEGNAALTRLILPALRSLGPAPGGPEQVRTWLPF